MIKLILKTQGTEADPKTYNYEYDQPVVTLGRLKENDIQLPHSTVSGFHAQILKEGENYYLVDRGSINGTFLNDQRLLAGEKKLLQDGDTIRIQSFELYFTSGVAVSPVDQGATVQVARQMVMELLGSWESQQEPRIIVMGGPNNGKQIELTEGKVIVMGRGNQCDIVIDHPTISRKHAEISFSWNGAFVKDLGSANGVYCNDVRIEGTYKLRDRDEIRLGQQNHSDPVRLVFSNPAEALLSKIEEVQITDSKPGAVESKNITSEQEQPVLPETAPEAAPSEANAISPVPVPPPSGPEVAAVREQAPKKKGTSAMTIGLMIGVALIVLLAVVAIGLLFYSGKQTVSEQIANPDKGTSGDLIVIFNQNLDTELIRTATISGREAPILEKKKNEIQLKVPSFPNVRTGTQQTEIILEGEKGTVAKAPFLLILLPEIKKIEPVSGRSGSVVILETSGAAENLEVYFGSRRAPVVSQNRSQLTVSVPAIEENVPDDGLKLPVTLALEGTRSKEGRDFLILPGIRIQSVIPSSANSGADVRIVMDEVPAFAVVYFDNTQAAIKTTTANEIVVTVPAFPESIPEGGRVISIHVRVKDVPVGQKAEFTLLPEYIESFQLSFSAQPYSSALGFNEHSVGTNIGTFLVLVAKDEYASSRARAEVIARNLNDKIPFFRQNSSARISLEKLEGINSIFAGSDVLDHRELLLRVFPDDALAYSKITQRMVTVDALAEWWRMLIDSYYKVFVQVQSPSSTGILGAGGSVLQQIYNFYSVKSPQGTKYYKKDFLDNLPQEQRNKLIALSMSPPKKISSVDGKWGGRMTNNLYSNISDADLELVLTLRQSGEGTVSGTAEVNWKVGMGRNEGGFENVAYKKLGTFPLSGMYRKSQAYPLEFTFVEKDSRRLNFVGRLEGEALVGNFEVSSTGEEGSWSVRLR